ncbi:3-hydroxyanthranilate 3,4-dioxygenase [Thalassotalea sp. M1531]|uniref:3-hydroxyanthranilate 3,4-dioxygenase n=1 Tax=Thalassotalea algicola TaxID=2716224 RepID=A0A7Y0Q668_9GAMM|nr:3-hydroxyanthranilate 3,4-dioxygenase [Thalassotalea algicola]NMP31068.1 3-hydroxyanthranilate 3,4-dioxygenase [Thalassotalea algicola]
MSFALPFNLNQWIEDHRHLLKPPVCNKQVFEQDDFIVMIVGGPNNRTDYHYNETPELFYQLEGEMVLKVIDNDEFKDISIKAGEIFLLPPKMLHSPQRMAGSVGMVVEQKRAPNQADALVWFCPSCKHKLYQESFCLDNIETDLPIVFENFYQNLDNCTCSQCQTVTTKG